MFKDNEIAVVTTDGGIFFKVYACDKKTFMDKKGSYLGTFVDMIAGQIRDALADMDCQEYVFITEDGKCYLNQIH